MRVFVTGATGYIGRVISEKLLVRGHQVIGLARSDEAASHLHTQHIEPHRGDLRQKDSLAAGALKADAVIHTAASRDMEAARWEYEAVAAMLDVLKGTGKTFIYTSGASIVGDTGDQLVDETYPIDPQNFRSSVEALALQYAQQAARVVIIRPSFVYGRGGGILPRYTAYARSHGIAGYVLPGDNHWPFVHVDDLANLYQLALEAAKTGSIYNTAAGEPIPMASLSQVIADVSGASLTAWTPEEATPILGGIAHMLSINLRISGQKAVQQLNWSPSAITLAEEIERLLSGKNLPHSLGD